MTTRRVVLTGLGTVNPVAHDVPGFWDGLMTGRSGIARIARFDPDSFASKIGGEVKEWEPIPADRFDPRESKRMDRFCQLAVASALEAVADSGIDFSREDVERCGVIVGSRNGGLQEFETQHARMRDKGPGRISPFTVPKLMANAASGHIAIVWGLMGPNHSVVSACASAANSVGGAVEAIRHGRADVIIAGGSEAALTPMGLASFCAMKGLSTRNDEPQRASRPFDKDRDGFLLSEGAGLVVIEELEHARKRDAKIYGELIGYGASGDGHHITAPDPEGRGACLAMRRALQDAGIHPDEVDYINAHGTSTDLGDAAETRAIKTTFGRHCYDGLMVSSTKSSTGHLLGASGGVELIACAKALETHTIPATYNLETPDDGCDLDYVPLTPRDKKVNIVLSNSFGFGGHNACLILKRYDG